MTQGIKKYFGIGGVRSIVYAIAGKLTNRIYHMEIKRKDCKHPFRLRVPSADSTAYQLVFIKKEYDFRVETSPEVIVDAGANIGLASIYFANKYPDAKIIAIEPEQSNFELLKENVAPYSQVTPIQAALWDKNEEINLIDPGFGSDAFMTDVKHPSENVLGKTCHTVNAMTVDKLMMDFTLTKINILKIDIEGAEREVFDDPSSWIEKVDSIIIELHERKKKGCNHNFYNSTNGFDNEWSQGENVCLSRGDYLSRYS